MRVASVAASILFLLVLLTWLSFHAINSDAELFDRALGALDHFTMTEYALQRDVLSARAGVLRNYDPLVDETRELNLSLLRLRESGSGDPRSAAMLDRLAASVAGQETLVEQFKSNNALLQNSLAYFGRYGASIGASQQTEGIVPA